MTKPLSSAVVRIRAADGRIVGAGFLVGERQALTCAHVVAGALGLPDSTGNAAGKCIWTFLVALGHILTPKILIWQPREVA